MVIPNGTWDVNRASSELLPDEKERHAGRRASMAAARLEGCAGAHLAGRRGGRATLWHWCRGRAAPWTRSAVDPQRRGH